MAPFGSVAVIACQDIVDGPVQFVVESVPTTQKVSNMYTRTINFARKHGDAEVRESKETTNVTKNTQDADDRIYH